MEATIENLDRIKLNLNFDVEKMKSEVNLLDINKFIYYNVVSLRGPAHMIDPSLPNPPPADDYADGSWTDWKNTADLEESPYLKSIVEYFQTHTKVTLVRLLRLAANEIVKEHTDPTLGIHIEKSVIRLTIPIISPEEVEFYLNKSIVPMKPGECWYLRLTDIHSIINKSNFERINMSIDLIPNNWVTNLIEKGMS
ncbi:MAG: aspartyl/asparaginyl beta-hydroxylase domain-containing protein [Flavobacteriales bacterium]|nr:aspartyl/asparaginyl beta-hydroxylase domain-containing protein [Flavobacteriales bacterium]